MVGSNTGELWLLLNSVRDSGTALTVQLVRFWPDTFAQKYKIIDFVLLIPSHCTLTIEYSTLIMIRSTKTVVKRYCMLIFSLNVTVFYFFGTFCF